MHFQAGVKEVSHSELPDILGEAARQGIPTLFLDVEGEVDRVSFLRAARTSLPLDPPMQSSRSWDAFSDSLWEGIRLLNGEQLLIVWRNVHLDAGNEDLQTALAILADTAQSLTDPVTTSRRAKRVSIYLTPAKI
ncbi:barstar family protein [Streptomyces sp. NPDC006692]|uniref:barstar family protein n=1 Tax=Streptomyces sp. NPDC006692 TaxID=3364758 RepID=UPI0036A950DE